MGVLFVLSAKELYGINNPNVLGNSSSYNRPWWQYEGTGAAHNEQYKLFRDKGLTYSRYSYLTCSDACWLRTSYYVDGVRFHTIYTDGSLGASGNTSARGVCPCFCV